MKVLVERLDVESRLIVGDTDNNPFTSKGNVYNTASTVSATEYGSIMGGVGFIGSNNVRSAMSETTILAGEQIFAGPNGTNSQKYRVRIARYKQP